LSLFNCVNTLKLFVKRKIIVNKELIIYLTLFIVSIIIRIPRIPHMIGSDAFEVLWMAKAIAFGEGMKWIIHPLSVFGFYPFSFYPVGFPLIIACFLKLGLSDLSTSVLISIFLVLIAEIGVIKLSKELFSKKSLQILFVFSFIFSPNFIKLTYSTLVSRAPIMALSPWLFYYLYKFRREKKKRDIIWILSIIIFSTLIHRMWIIFIILLIIFTVGYYIDKHIEKAIKKLKNLNDYLPLIITIITILFLCVIGYFFFGVTDARLVSPWFSDEKIGGLIINAIIDYGFRIGAILIFFPFGVYSLLKIKKQKEEHRYFLVFIIIFLAFSWTFPLYITVVFLPMYLWISIIGLEKLNSYFSKKNLKYKNFVFYLIPIFYVIFNVSYAFLITNSWNYLTIFFVLSTSFFIIYFILKKRFYEKFNFKKININLKYMFFHLSLLFITLTIVDGQIIFASRYFPYPYISTEEIMIADLINEIGINGSIFVAQAEVARHISGYGFLPTLAGFHHGQQIYYDWGDLEEIKSNTTLSLSEVFRGNFFEYLNIDPEFAIFFAVNNLQYTNVEMSNYIKSLNIQYVIALKDNHDVILPYVYLHKKVYPSNFIASLAVVPALFETQHLVLWKLY